MKNEAVHKDEEISLRDVLLKLGEWYHYILRKWKWVVLFALLGGILGFVYTLFQKTYYTATVTFVTESGDSNNTSAYAGLASEFGVSLSSGNLSGGLFEGPNIFDLMKSRRMIMQTLLTPVVINDTSTLLIDRYIKMEKLRNDWDDNAQLKDISFDIDTSKFTVNHYAILKGISGKIAAANLDFEKGAIFSVSCKSKDEYFSKGFVEKLIDNVSAFYIKTKTEKARENLDIVQRQLDSVRNQLYGAMGNVASFQDINQNLVRQGPKVQQQKGNLKVQVNSAIYQQLVTSLEAAKVDLRKETPLFEVIDEPMFPLDSKHPSLIKWIIIGIILGVIVSTGWLLLRKILVEIIGSAKEES